MALTPQQRDTIIRTIAGEAANQGVRGQTAVAWSILNRTSDPRWPSDPAKVVKQPQQFSTWNKGKGGNTIGRKLSPKSDLYQQIGQIVDGVWSGSIPDPTGGAVYYGNVPNAKAGWGDFLNSQGNVSKIGAHTFAGLTDGGWMPEYDPSSMNGLIQLMGYAPPDNPTLAEQAVTAEANNAPPPQSNMSGRFSDAFAAPPSDQNQLAAILGTKTISASQPQSPNMAGQFNPLSAMMQGAPGALSSAERSALAAAHPISISAGAGLLGPLFGSPEQKQQLASGQFWNRIQPETANTIRAVGDIASPFANAAANLGGWLPSFGGSPSPAAPKQPDNGIDISTGNSPLASGIESYRYDQAHPTNIFTAYGQSGQAPSNIIMADLGGGSIPFSSGPAMQGIMAASAAPVRSDGVLDPFGNTTTKANTDSLLGTGSNSKSVPTQTVTAPPGGNYGEAPFPSLVTPAYAEPAPGNLFTQYGKSVAQPQMSMPGLSDMLSSIGINSTTPMAPEIAQPAPVEPPSIEVQQPVKKAVPTPIVLPAMVAQPKKTPLADILSNPLGRGALGLALGGPLGALLGAGSAYLQKNGGLGSIFGGSGSVPALSNVTSHSANYNPTSGGSQYAYQSGTDSQGNQVVSYRTNSGNTITYRNNPDGTTTMYNL